MKKLKKIVVLFAAALFCLLPALSQPLTAHASEPVTWYLKYVDSINEWRFQKGSWDDTGYHRELYYMHQDIKDGDVIVIDGSYGIELEVNVKLSNLTILNQGGSVVKASSIDNFYAGQNTTSAVNCDVTNAYIYEKCTVNFNNNVSYLEVIGNQGPKADIAAVGTVGHLKGWDGSKAYYEGFNFTAGKLYIKEGQLWTDAADYSKSASAKPAAPAPAPSATTTTPSAPSSDYDEVPKTGSFSVSPLWFFGIAALCLVGYGKLNKR